MRAPSSAAPQGLAGRGWPGQNSTVGERGDEGSGRPREWQWSREKGETEGQRGDEGRRGRQRDRGEMKREGNQGSGKGEGRDE